MYLDLYPSSLAYQVYLGLGVEDLSELKCKSFNGLNFSTNNLNNCAIETLNQLDVDSFLYFSILVAKSCFEGENKYQDKIDTGKPLIRPAPNMIPRLCEENKVGWRELRGFSRPPGAEEDFDLSFLYRLLWLPIL